MILGYGVMLIIVVIVALIILEIVSSDRVTTTQTLTMKSDDGSYNLVAVTTFSTRSVPKEIRHKLIYGQAGHQAAPSQGKM